MFTKEHNGFDRQQIHSNILFFFDWSLLIIINRTYQLQETIFQYIYMFGEYSYHVLKSIVSNCWVTHYNLWATQVTFQVMT